MLLKVFPSLLISGPGKGGGWSVGLPSVLLLPVGDPVLLDVPAEEAAALPGPHHLARSGNGFWMWQSRGVPGPLPLLLLPKLSACHERSPKRGAGQAQPRVLRDLPSSSSISSFAPLLPGASPSGTDSCLDTLFTQRHTKNLAVFPTKASCVSWRHQQLIPAGPGCSSRSHQSHPDTSHWLRINQASATSSSLSGEATAPLPRDGPSSLELPFRATQGQPHLYRGFSRRQKSSSSSGCACRDGGCGDGGGLESSECSLERRRSLALFLSSCIFYKVLPQKYKITRYM